MYKKSEFSFLGTTLINIRGGSLRNEDKNKFCKLLLPSNSKPIIISATCRALRNYGWLNIRADSDGEMWSLKMEQEMGE
jgi:hypothetical protein